MWQEISQLRGQLRSLQAASSAPAGIHIHMLCMRQLLQ